MIFLPPVECKGVPFGNYKLWKSNEVGSYRSVVSDSTGCVKCLAPAKGKEYMTFKSKYAIENISVQAHVEGTMINVFFDKDWVLCTKSNVGATNKFIPTSPCFADMFREAAIRDEFDLNALDKQFAYSFVLQHECNRIISPVEKSAIYLIAVYKVHYGTVFEGCYLEVHPIPRVHGVKTPAIFHFNSYSEMESFAADASFENKGFMLHGDEERTKLTGTEYALAKELRGEDACFNWRILALPLTDVCALLKYYPEHATEGNNLLNALQLYTKNLHSQYIECFINHTKPLKEFGFQYKQHLYHLHQGFKLTGEIVRLLVVKKYVATLHPAQILHALQWKKITLT